MKNKTNIFLKTIIILFALCIIISICKPVLAIELNSEEKAYLEKKETIIFVSQTQYPPFEFIDQIGQPKGMSIELARWIATEFGFKTKFINTHFKEAQQFILSKKADVLTSFFYSKKRDELFNFTNLIFEVPASIFILSKRVDVKDINELQGMRVAMQEGDYAKEFLESKNIAFKVAYTKNFNQAINLVVRGKADVLIGDEQIVLYYIFKNNMQNEIKKIGQPLYIGQNSMAAIESEKILVNILNKGIKSAQQKGILENINKKWIGTHYSISSSIFSKYLPVIIITSIIVLLLIFSIWLWNIRLRKAIQKKNLELKSSQDQYKTVVQSTPDLLYRTDMNGKIVFMSASVYNLAGYSVEEAIGMNMAQEVYLIPEDRELFLEKLKKNGFVKNFEAQLKRKDGSIWWASTNSHFYKDQGGNIMGVEGVTRDITEKKEAERALQKSEIQLRAILEANPNPMILYNAWGHPKYLNPSFSKTFGWSLEELEGKPIPFVPDDLKKEASKNIKKIYKDGEIITFESKRITKDNRILDVFISAAITKGKDEPGSLVVNLTDITERKALEAQFEQAEKMESLGTLAGGIAHDFNNLLSGIFGYINLALKKSSEQSVQEFLAKALSASDRAKGLTRQLLTFSKGGAPVKEIEPLIPFLEETTLFALSGSSVSCTFDIPDDLWMCDYDKNQIGQVIDNIVINATHAMPSGGSIDFIASNIVFKKQDHVSLDPGNYVKISILDKGIGIPEKYLSRIFDPFFTTKQKGSGLGLTTCYSIVKKHGGFIDLESVQGSGTAFHIYLPSTGQAGKIENYLTDIIYKGSGNILVMDDDLVVLELIDEMLQDMGFSTVLTIDGNQAIDEFQKALDQKEPFKAIFLDLTVPGGKGGKDTVKEIRAIDKNIPVFVSSGYSEDTAIADPVEFGFTASIEKPFLISQLAQMLERYL